MKTPQNQQYLVALEQLGLSQKSAEVYLYLLNLGRLTAGTLIDLTGYKRGDLHYILDRLVAQGLIKKTRQKNKDIFQVESPWRLQELFNEQEQKIRLQQKNLQALLPQLASLFTLSTSQPFIRHLAGLSGLKTIYDEILHDKADLSIFAAESDRDNPALNRLINRSIGRQYRAGLKTRALISLFPSLDQVYLNYCRSRNIENRILPPEKFRLRSQIIIWGGKISLSSLRETVMTTIIENADIAQTFQTVFDMLWHFSQPEQAKLLAQVPARARPGFSRYLVE